MKQYHTPLSAHSRKSSAKSRLPLGQLSSNIDLIPQQCATFLQQKVVSLEQRVKNLNSQHSECRSTTANKKEISLSPFVPQKNYSNHKEQSYYETIINKRLEKIIDRQPSENREKAYSQYDTQYRLHQNTLMRIQELSKKLRKFKLIKDQNQDECAPSLAKIKCFCQDYYQDCFDFYRCTDLISLKYFIYLLLQEINCINCVDAFKTADNNHFYQQQIDELRDQLNNPNIKFQKMITDTQVILKEIINSFQNKPNSNLAAQVECLNNQMTKIRDNMNTNNSSYLDDRQNTQQSTKYETNIYQDYTKKMLDEQTTINKQLMDKLSRFQSEQKNIIAAETRELQAKIHMLQEEQKRKSTVMENERNQNQIQIRLISEEKARVEQEKSRIEQEKFLVEKELATQQEIYKQLNNRIVEISKNLDQVVEKNSSLSSENDRLSQQVEKRKQIEQKYYDLVNDNQQMHEKLMSIKQEGDTKQKYYYQIESDNNHLQRKIEELIQNRTDKSALKELEQQLQEQQKVIAVINEEAQYMGNIALFATDIMARQHDLPAPLLMLQRDLMLKKPLLVEKLEVLTQLGQNFYPMEKRQSEAQILDWRENRNSQLLDNDLLNTKVCEKEVIRYRMSDDNLMLMLLIQSQTIEKMIEF